MAGSRRVGLPEERGESLARIRALQPMAADPLDHRAHRIPVRRRARWLRGRALFSLQ